MALELLMQEAQGLSEEALMEVVRFVRFIKSEDRTAGAAKTAEPRKVRQAGGFRGQIWMAEDFDAPMDEFKEYM